MTHSNEEATMNLHPLKRDGNTVTFIDGTTVDVFDMAREWGRWQEALHGERCMMPECTERASHNAHVYGVHVGRLCDLHLTANVAEQSHG